MPARLTATLLFLALAAPAAAQSRTERIAEDIARQVEATADAVGIVTDSVQRSVDSLRFRGPQRLAVERCAPLVERFGRMRVDDVRRHRSGGWRVYGTVGGAAIGDSNGWRKGYVPRAFTCTVRDDGRVKLKTSRMRRY